MSSLPSSLLETRGWLSPRAGKGKPGGRFHSKSQELISQKLNFRVDYAWGNGDNNAFYVGIGVWELGAQLPAKPQRLGSTFGAPVRGRSNRQERKEREEEN